MKKYCGLKIMRGRIYEKNKSDRKNVTEKTDKDKKTYLSVIKKLRLL